jgi:hypothetical protein
LGELPRSRKFGNRIPQPLSRKPVTGPQGRRRPGDAGLRAARSVGQVPQR